MTAARVQKAVTKTVESSWVAAAGGALLVVVCMAAGVSPEEERERRLESEVSLLETYVIKKRYTVLLR